MAQLLPTPHCPPAIDFRAENYREQINAAEAALEREGELLRFPVADGHAVYLVRSIRPPRLQWVDWLDGYQADRALIRGLTARDIEQRLARARALRTLFARKT